MKIKHVFGNVLRIDIPLTIKIRTIDEGEPSEREEPFYPDATKGCIVELANNYNRKIEYQATIKGNIAHIEDNGKISIGQYKLTVKCYDADGNPYRYMVRDIVEICDATADAGIEAGVEFNAETYTLEGAVFISYGGGSLEQVQADWEEEDETSKAYIKNKPTHIVEDESYVHTDNNYTDEEKAKLANTYTTTQTDKAIEQAKKDVSWKAEEYYVLGTGNSASGMVRNPKGRVVYYSSERAAFIRIFSLPHYTSTGISFKVIGTPIEDTDNFVRIVVAGNEIIFRTSNRPTIFKAGVTYEVEYTYIFHNNLSCVYLESWSGGTSTAAYTGSYNDLSDKPNIPVVPTNVSAFNNDAGYITKSVNDLVNYYLKADVYNKTEVANLIAAIQQFHYEIYASISAVTSPAGNVLYLIGPTGMGSDRYEEYVYDSTKQEPWVKIGDTSIDLSNYYTKGQTDSAITQALNAALANYATTEALTLLLAGKQDVISDLAEIRSGAAAGATAYQKPQGGIPSSDMSQAVQTSLEKANTALQQHQDISGKQDTLVSGTNIKTINNESVLGSGNINIVTELPSNLAYTSNDNGEGIIPSDGIRAESVTSAATMSINPDVVTVINGVVGTAAITLQVPNDNLAHVWDILMTTDSSVAITFAMSNSATILYPNGFSVGASKAIEISVIGVGTKYYLRYGEFD